MRTIIGFACILSLGGYLILRDNSNKDRDLAWLTKSLKSTPTAVAGDQHARHI